MAQDPKPSHGQRADFTPKRRPPVVQRSGAKRSRSMSLAKAARRLLDSLEPLPVVGVLANAAIDTLVARRPETQWLRIVMSRHIAVVLQQLDPTGLDAVEVSGEQYRTLGWRSYTSLHFPQFDLCNPPAPTSSYDLVIAEQVLEHVEDPIAAVRTLRSLCADNGHVLVSTPFLVRIHGAPSDHWRFTPSGLRLLLQRGGLEVLWVNSWGNRSCIGANLDKWARYRPWHSLRNEPRLPVVVWALCRLPADSGSELPAH